ncbi:MAG: DcrB/PsbP domain-containing protein [Facklamia hominis]
MAGLDNGVNYIVDAEEKEIVNALPFNPLKHPEQLKQLQDQDAGYQFSHTMEDQIGGQLQAGFLLKELYEDTNGEGRLHQLNIPSYVATWAVKV